MTFVALAALVASCGAGTETTPDDGRNVALPIGFLGKQAAAVTVGRNHSCVITTTGTVECWGDNSTLQLGNSVVQTASAPVVVQGLPANKKAVRLAEGGTANHTCVVLEDGELWCWGSNSRYQAQNRAASASSVPRKIVVNKKVADVAVGFDSTCLVNIDGEVQCWGNSIFGQLGYGNNVPANAPVAYETLFEKYLETNGRVVQIAAGYASYCVLYDDQTVDCWGSNSSGQVGGIGLSVTSPRQVMGLGDVVDIAVGTYHACALTQDHEVWCWGSNGAGQIPGFSGPSTVTPVKVAFRPESGPPVPVRYKSIYAGGDTTCVIDEFETAKCWGRTPGAFWNSDPSLIPQYPTLVMGTDQILVGALGDSHMCIVTKFGLPRCIGTNAKGELGRDSVQNSPQSIGDVTGYIASNATIEFPTFTFIGVDFGLIGGQLGGGGVVNPDPNAAGAGAAGGAGGVQQPAPPATDPAAPPATDPAFVPVATDPAAASPSTTAASATGNTQTAATKAPVRRLQVRKTATPRTLARWASMTVPKGSRITFTVTKASARRCSKSAGKLRGVRAGTCRVRVKVAKPGIRTRTKLLTVTVVR
jgi:alpha-tubulin suppressor-like RCC1 family protein